MLSYLFEYIFREREKKELTLDMESKIITGCILSWYSFSMLQTVIDQRFFVKYPCPLTITFSHMVINSLSLSIATIFSGEQKLFVSRANLGAILGLAVFKCSVSVFSHYTALLLPVPLMEACKSLAPVFVVIMTSIVYGTKYPNKILFSVLIMISGVFLATLTQSNIVYEGLFTVILMIISSQSKNLATKHMFQTVNLHPFGILFNVHFFATFMVLPFWIKIDLPFLLTSEDLQDQPVQFAFTIALQGLLSSFLHIIKAIILSNVSSLTYSVVENGKSLSKTILGFVLYQRPTGILNLLGTFLAVVGVFYYSQVKAEDKDRKSKEK